MKIKQQSLSQIDSILSKLDIEFVNKGVWKTACCKIHGGDNRGALAWNSKTNKWVCFTHGCQEEWGNDLLGLISGILQVSRVEANDWLLENAEGDMYKNRLGKEEKIDKPLPEFWLKKLFKTDFYVKRGFSQTTVDAFEHGKAEAHDLRNRIVFAIRDEKGIIRGFSGRWAGKEIEKDGKTVCVSDSGVVVPKWKHTKFTKTNYLYRIVESKDFSKNEMIIVESIGNVMRFYDAKFKNCVAVMGSNLSFRQAQLIIQHTKTAILAFDNDKAGHKVEKQARKLLEPFVEVKSIWTPDDRDWAECSNQEVQEIYAKR